ncbi:isochorismatase [Burkholderia sp. WAC0059]|uniref:isochorismatase family protein n=1 Tax=Burkholderia sp. WAC0059 TaxID=2066022 RepID=UPI000C7ED50F|nr:isochorismatase family protein [Burkholderia sp. WAC0059]PLZ01185.1 isochorismatase [Burkholderia sp. WAC0059]
MTQAPSTLPLTLDAPTTALVLIDLQHGIVGRTLAPYSGPQVVANAKRIADALRMKGGTVVFVRVQIEDLLHLPADTPMRAPDAPPPPPEASQLVPEAGVQPGDLVVTKRQWGAFYGTDLEQQLRRRGIGTIVLGGIATNFGVESTARQAFDQGWRLVFVEDATSSLAGDMHRFTMDRVFRLMGHVRTTDEVIGALGA